MGQQQKWVICNLSSNHKTSILHKYIHILVLLHGITTAHLEFATAQSVCYNTQKLYNI